MLYILFYYGWSDFTAIIFKRYMEYNVFYYICKYIFFLRNLCILLKKTAKNDLISYFSYNNYIVSCIKKCIYVLCIHDYYHKHYFTLIDFFYI